MNHRSSILMRVGSFVLLLSILLQPQSSVDALTTLTVTPITWNVIGLDSNNVNVGPNHFPIGYRVCNTGSESATNVTAVFNWDSSNTYINIRPSTLSSINLGTLAPGNCTTTPADAYFEVEVTRNSSAYDTTRDYHISVTAGNVTGTINTPTRQLYVEHLVSQNRNATTNVEFGTSLGSMTSVPAGGTMNLMVGNNYYIRLTGFTATQGYEQLETFLNIPNTIFQTLSVSSTYTADSSATVSSPNDKLYGDACVWESNQSDPDYRSCLSTGKVGGNITVTYYVKILQVPSSPLVNPVPLSSLIYDFSGSSYHYNADYSVGTRYANIITPTLTKSFSPKTINPGGTSTLTFTITNPGSTAISSVNFTDNLPSNVTISGTTVSYTSCGSPSPSSVTNGATSLSFSNITVAGNTNCTIVVTVTSSTNGTYNNTTTNLLIDTFDTGSNGSDTLTVASTPACTPNQTIAQWTFPSGFNVTNPVPSTGSGTASGGNLTLTSFTAGTNSWGTNGNVTTGATLVLANDDYLEFAINSSLFTGSVNLTFQGARANSGNAPTGIAVYYSGASGNGAGVEPNAALYSNATILTTTLTAIGGTLTINTPPTPTTYVRIYFFNSGNTNPGADGYVDNVTFTGCATAPTPPTLSKSFSPDPISTGTTTTLTFTVTNTSSTTALTGVNFTDVLPSGLTVTSGSSSTCGGTLTTTAPRTIELSGGSLAASGSCNINVTVTGASAGSYTNTSTSVSSTQTGPNTTGTGFGTDTLTVIDPPVIQKSFTANPIFTGDTTTLLFSINNPNTATTLTGVSFTDTLPAGLDVTSGSSSQCGGTLTLTDNNPAVDTVVLTGGSLIAGASCSFSVTVTGTTVGLKTNTVTVSSTNGGTGNTDTADVVVRARTLSLSTLKSVSTSISGPWSPTLTVTLPGSVYYRFIVENTGDDILNNVNISDPNVNTSTCTWINGNGATISTGGANFTLPVANANDEQIATCIIGPITALGGTNPNTVTADDNNLPDGTGTPNTSDTSTATYTGIAPNLTITKTDSDADDTVLPGDSFDWTITVTNNGNATANFANTQVIMSDALPGTDGHYTIGPVNETNGGTPPTGTIDCAIASGPTLSCVANGAVTLPANASFSLTFTVTVPPTPATANILANTAIVDPNNVVTESNENASDNQSTNTITVLGPPSISKNFSPDPIAVNGISTLTFTITNPNTTVALTGISFTDSLPAGLQVATTPNASASAGCGSPTFAPVSGNTSLTFSNGTIAASGTCTVTVDVTATTSGTKNNTSGNVSSTNGGTGNTANDTLTVLTPPSISKNYSPDPIAVGGTTTLTFTITNPNATTALTGVAFTDSFPAGTEVAATPNASATSCGSPTFAPTAGVTSISFSGGTIAGGGTCTVTVDVTATTAGTKNNTSGNVSSTNGGTGNTATDSLTVIAPPSISKNFSPDPINVGDISTLTFTITNPNASTALTGVAFTDSLPAGLQVAATPNVSTLGCGTPTFTPASGNTSLTFSGGTIAASGSCVVSVDVIATTAGLKNNTSGNVSSTNGGTGNTANDTLQVNAPSLDITKDGTLDITASAPTGSLNAGDEIDYTITVNNTGSSTLTGVSVSDPLISGTLDCDSGTGGNQTTGFAINVGGSLTCTGTYIITQTDLNNNGGGDGDIDNTATADSNETGPDTAPNEETITQTPQLTLTKSITSGDPYDTAGDVINYSFLVENTGNVSLTGPVTIDDDQTTNESCPAVTTVGNNDTFLDPGETITCTASYIVTLADVNSGSVTNVAEATAGGTTSNTDTQTANATPSPELTLTKSITSGDPYDSVGDVINYSFLVENTGNVSLTGPVIIADDQSTDESCPAVNTVGNLDNELDPGETITCTSTHTVTLANLNNGSVTNIASASADGTTSNNDTQTADATQSPALTLTKSISSGDPYDSVGDVINYSFLVENTGNVSLTGPVIIADDQSTDESCPAVTTVGNLDNELDPGETITCTSTHTITLANLNNGSVTNIASASADSTTSNNDTQTADATQSPALTLIKSITSGDPYDSVGDIINYSFSVENTGNVSLTGPVVIADDQSADESCPAVNTVGNLDNELDPGETITCTSTHSVTLTNLNNGSVTNIASASADGTTSNNDTQTANATQSPNLTIVKTETSTGPYVVGNTITYSIVVTNTGNTTLTNVDVSDNNATLGTCTPTIPTSLDPGDNVTCDASHLVTLSDINTGSFTNTASVTDDDVCPAAGVGVCSDDVTVNFTQSPALTIVKTETSTGPYNSGDTITYSIVVTNIGNVTLTNVDVTDNNATLGTCTPTIPTSLDPGDDVTCAASHVVSGTDITNGSFANTASVTDDDVCPAAGVATCSDDVTVTFTQSPALNVTKSGTLDMTVVTPTGQADAGDVINYTITVQNTGNQNLTGVSVSDPLLSNLDCDGTAGAPFVTTGLSITVGNSLTCIGTYTLTQNDLDTNGGGDGDIDNTATADSNETPSDNVDEEVTIPLAPTIQVDKTLQSSTFTNPTTLRVTYLIDVANTGNVALTNVQVTDDLVAAFPGATSFSVFTHFSSGTTSLTINNAFDGDADQNLLAGTDTLQVGESGQITLIVDVDTGGDEDTYVNTAVGTGTPPTGPDVTDDGSTGTPSFVDPALAKSANPNQASVGETVTFTITVTNNGNLPAPNVVVTDPLPAQFDVTAVSVTGDDITPTITVNGSAYPPVTGTAPFTVEVTLNNDLDVDEVVVIQITTVVNSLGTPPIANNATLTTTDQTDNLLNNAAIVPLTILSPSTGGEIPALPDTGFAPNRITKLLAQPDDMAYVATDVILEIPSLKLKMPIVGVPLKKNGWDITWLTNQAGWLEGSAFPSWNGNSVLTSHVTLANGLSGPFANLGKLKYGDQIIVHANGQKYIFEIRTNTTVAPNSKTYFRHEKLPWLTLITCKEYDEDTNTYKKRIVVRAVLVEVVDE